MRMLGGLFLLVAFTGGAAASGGISCGVEDETTSLSVEGGVTHGMGSALFSFSGKLELRSDDVREDLRVTEFTREHVPQYWLDGDTLKLRLYREREGDAPHGYVEVILETVINDDGDDVGEYIVAVYDITDAVDGDVDPVQFTGSVTCMVE